MSDDIKIFYKFIKNYMASYGYKIQQHDVDDVFQRAVLRVIEHGGGYNSPNFYGYLVNSCMQFFGRDLPKTRHADVFREHLSDKSRNDSKVLEILDEMERIRPIIDTLAEGQRDAILMEYWGATPKQAAQAHEVKITVEYVNRCRAAGSIKKAMTKST